MAQATTRGARGRVVNQYIGRTVSVSRVSVPVPHLQLELFAEHRVQYRAQTREAPGAA